MRKPTLCPALALVPGAAAAGLRMWHRAGYDASGLPVPYAPPAVVLTVFLVLCAGIFLFLALRRPKVLNDQTAALPRGGSSALLFAVAGVLILLCGVLNLKAAADGYLQTAGAAYGTEEARREAFRAFLMSYLLPCVTALASVPTAAALLSRAKRAKTAEGSPNAFSCLMPPVFCWLWLIEVYRQNTSDPIVWNYLLPLLAVIALLVSTFERAGFCLGVGKPRRSVFTSLLALTLAAAALPDCGGLANAAALIALALQTLAELSALLAAPEEEEGTDPAAPTETKEESPHEQ